MNLPSSFSELAAAAILGGFTYFDSIPGQYFQWTLKVENVSSANSDDIRLMVCCHCAEMELVSAMNWLPASEEQLAAGGSFPFPPNSSWHLMLIRNELCLMEMHLMQRSIFPVDVTADLASSDRCFRWAHLISWPSISDSIPRRWPCARVSSTMPTWAHRR